MEQKDDLKGLAEHITAAIDCIVGHMTDPLTPPHVQLRASQIYLDLSMKYLRTADLEEKVTFLEAHLGKHATPWRAENDENAIDAEEGEEYEALQ